MTQKASEDFANYVGDLVKFELKQVILDLSEDGLTFGKIKIRSCKRKIVERVIRGDRIRHRSDSETERKIRAFVKQYLIHELLGKASKLK